MCPFLRFRFASKVCCTGLGANREMLEVGRVAKTKIEAQVKGNGRLMQDLYAAKAGLQQAADCFEIWATVHINKYLTIAVNLEVFFPN